MGYLRVELYVSGVELYVCVIRRPIFDDSDQSDII